MLPHQRTFITRLPSFWEAAKKMIWTNWLHSAYITVTIIMRYPFKASSVKVVCNLSIKTKTTTQLITKCKYNGQKPQKARRTWFDSRNGFLRGHPCRLLVGNRLDTAAVMAKPRRCGRKKDPAPSRSSCQTPRNLARNPQRHRFQPCSTVVRRREIAHGLRKTFRGRVFCGKYGPNKFCSTFTLLHTSKHTGRWSDLLSSVLACKQLWPRPHASLPVPRQT